jgi:hypothetical protein
VKNDFSATCNFKLRGVGASPDETKGYLGCSSHSSGSSLGLGGNLRRTPLVPVVLSTVTNTALDSWGGLYEQ